MIGTSVLAVGLATLQVVAPTGVAFVVGILALASFVGVSVVQPDVPALHRAAWCLLLTYILVAIIALARP